jgi:hypothetical protein
VSLHAALLSGSKGIETPLLHPSYPQTSPWVGFSMAESAELPGWAQSWRLSSQGGSALPKAPVPLCQLLLALSALGVENQVANVRTELCPPFPPHSHRFADSENRSLLRGDPDPYQA